MHLASLSLSLSLSLAEHQLGGQGQDGHEEDEVGPAGPAVPGEVKDPDVVLLHGPRLGTVVEVHRAPVD